MLSSLRKYAAGRTSQIFMGLLVASFGLWGISDIFRGFSQENLAWVGNTEITQNDFALRYQQELRNQESRLGSAIPAELALRIGLPQQVLNQMLASATLDENARRFDLGLSDDGLRAWLATIPAFLDASGHFDRSRFQTTAQQTGLTEQGLLQELRDERIRLQVISAVAGNAPAPQAYRRAVQEYLSEERDIRYLVLTSAQAGAVPDPTEDQLTAYFDENKALWRAPESRTIEALKVSPANLAAAEEVTEGDARQYYNDHIDSYTAPEQRRIRQILFPDQAAADAAAAALASGQSFDELMASRNLAAADVDLGMMTRAAMVDPAVAEAAFSLAVGQTSPVVAGRFGPVIVQVEEIVPQQVQPFEAVQADIAKLIGTQRAAGRMDEIEAQVTDSLSGGDSLSEIATKLGLTTQTTPAFDNQGNGTDGNPVAGIPGGSDVVQAAFSSDVGIQNDPLHQADTGWIWYTVADVQPAHDQVLADVRDKVVAAWKKDEAAKQLAKVAADLATRLRGGTDIAAAGAELGVAVSTASALTRQSNPQDLPHAAVLAAFDGPQGSVAVAANGDNQIVLQVVAARVPEYFPGAPVSADAEAQIATQIGNDVLQQYINELRVSRYGFSVDQQAVTQIVQAAHS